MSPPPPSRRSPSPSPHLPTPSATSEEAPRRRTRAHRSATPPPPSLTPPTSPDNMPVIRRPSRLAARRAKIHLNQRQLGLSSPERQDKALAAIIDATPEQDLQSLLNQWRNPESRRLLIDRHRKQLPPSQDHSPPSLSDEPQQLPRSRSIRIRRPSQSLPLPKKVPKPKDSVRSRLRSRAPAPTSKQTPRPASSANRSVTLGKRKQTWSRRPGRKLPRGRSRVNVVDIEDDDTDEDNDDKNFEDDPSEPESEPNNDLDFLADADEEEALHSREPSPNEKSSSSDSDSVKNFVVEDEEDDDEEDDEEQSSEEDRPTKRRRKGRKAAAKKRNGRRKRTAPTDAFGRASDDISEKEQQQRLEYLVTQSAEIAKELHNALAETAEDPAQSSGDGERPVPGSASNQGALPAQKKQKEETFVAPNGLGCELQPHQVEGVSWLLTLDSQGLNSILADEMGLGKTIQAVAFVASLVISGSRGPHLVIAPKNVCEHWVEEVRRWYPGQLTVVSHLGLLEERLEQLDETLMDDNFDIMVTSYEIALRDLFSKKRSDLLPSNCMKALRAFRKLEFEYLIVDEAHRLKSEKSLINKAIRQYTNCQRRLLLTGTPLSNNMRELWCLMNILNPRIFGSKQTFETWFSAPFGDLKGQNRNVMTPAEKSVIVDRLHTVIRPFFRRRERKDICPSYSSADEVVVKCPLSALQRALLFHYQRRASARDVGVTNALMYMREASNHPYTACNAFDDPGHDLGPKLVATSGKFSFLHYAVPRLIASGHRLLIFSQFRAVLDYLEDLMELLDIKYGRLDGLSKTDDRLSTITQFNAENSDIPVFLLTTRAGGVGLNLQTADTVILFDSDWNPSADLQAVSRIQRIGQKKTVHILRLVSENSVDSIVVETAAQKLKTQDVVVRAGQFHTSFVGALDQKVRQKDLEAILTTIEKHNYLDDQLPQTDADDPEAQNPFSSSQSNRSAQEKRIVEWGKNLLRPGETEMQSVDLEHIWIDSTPDSAPSSIPLWLGKDANLAAAARALAASSAYEAESTYNDTLHQITLTGKFSKEDRARRAQRPPPPDFSCFDSDDDGRSREASDDSVDFSPMISDSDDAGGDELESSEIIEKEDKKSEGKHAVAGGDVVREEARIGTSQAVDNDKVHDNDFMIDPFGTPANERNGASSVPIEVNALSKEPPREEVPSKNLAVTTPTKEPNSADRREESRSLTKAPRLGQEGTVDWRPVARKLASNNISSSSVAQANGCEEGSVNNPIVISDSDSDSDSDDEDTIATVLQRHRSLSGPPPPAPLQAKSPSKTTLHRNQQAPKPMSSSVPPAASVPLKHRQPVVQYTPCHIPMPVNPPPPKDVSPDSNEQRALPPVQTPRTGKQTFSPTQKWIFLPLIDPNSIKVMCVPVFLDGAEYVQVKTLSEKAMMHGRAGDITTASHLCNQVSAMLKSWEGRQESRNIHSPSSTLASHVKSKVFVFEQDDPTLRALVQSMAPDQIKIFDGTKGVSVLQTADSSLSAARKDSQAIQAGMLNSQNHRPTPVPVPPMHPCLPMQEPSSSLMHIAPRSLTIPFDRVSLGTPPAGRTVVPNTGAKCSPQNAVHPMAEVVDKRLQHSVSQQYGNVPSQMVQVQQIAHPLPMRQPSGREARPSQPFQTHQSRSSPLLPVVRPNGSLEAKNLDSTLAKRKVQTTFVKKTSLSPSLPSARKDITNGKEVIVVDEGTSTKVPSIPSKVSKPKVSPSRLTRSSQAHPSPQPRTLPPRKALDIRSLKSSGETRESKDRTQAFSSPGARISPIVSTKKADVVSRPVAKITNNSSSMPKETAGSSGEHLKHGKSSPSVDVISQPKSVSVPVRGNAVTSSQSPSGPAYVKETVVSKISHPSSTIPNLGQTSTKSKELTEKASGVPTAVGKVKDLSVLQAVAKPSSRRASLRSSQSDKSEVHLLPSSLKRIVRKPMEEVGTKSEKPNVSQVKSLARPVNGSKSPVEASKVVGIVRPRTPKPPSSPHMGSPGISKTPPMSRSAVARSSKSFEINNIFVLSSTNPKLKSVREGQCIISRVFSTVDVLPSHQLVDGNRLIRIPKDVRSNVLPENGQKPMMLKSANLGSSVNINPTELSKEGSDVSKVGPAKETLPKALAAEQKVRKEQTPSSKRTRKGQDSLQSSISDAGKKLVSRQVTKSGISKVKVGSGNKMVEGAREEKGNGSMQGRRYSVEGREKSSGAKSSATVASLQDVVKRSASVPAGSRSVGGRSLRSAVVRGGPHNVGQGSELGLKKIERKVLSEVKAVEEALSQRRVKLVSGGGEKFGVENTVRQLFKAKGGSGVGGAMDGKTVGSESVGAKNGVVKAGKIGRGGKGLQNMRKSVTGTVVRQMLQRTFARMNSGSSSGRIGGEKDEELKDKLEGIGDGTEKK